MKKTKAELTKLKLPPALQAAPAASLPVEHRWYDTKRVIEILQQAMTDQWSWSNNTRCKYIDLHIDMRGHSCQVKDREGVVISIEKLKYQYGVK